MLELASGDTVEVNLRRVCQRIPSIFKKHPVEIFAPIASHGLDVRLSTDNAVFVRSSSFASLIRLKTVSGCEGLATKSGSGKIADVMEIDASYVQELIVAARAAYLSCGDGIVSGSYCRVSQGLYRGFCGVVSAISIDQLMAAVTIELLDRRIFLKTPLKNLQDLSHVPLCRRVFFHSPETESLESAEALAPYLHCTPPPTYEEHADTPDNIDHWAESGEKPRPRSHTMTNRIRKMIEQGNHYHLSLVKIAVDEMIAGTTKKTKNLVMVRNLVRRELHAIGVVTEKAAYYDELQKLAVKSGIPYQSPGYGKKHHPVKRHGVSRKKHGTPKLLEDICKACGHTRLDHRLRQRRWVRCSVCKPCKFFRELEIKKR